MQTGGTSTSGDARKPQCWRWQRGYVVGHTTSIIFYTWQRLVTKIRDAVEGGVA